MPRKMRIILPNCPHHIIQRGHNRQIIFAENSDYERYLNNVLELKAKFDIKVFAYCLMTNHVHLLLQPGDDAYKVPLFMKTLSARTTRYFNMLEGRTGTLWESRYKSSPVQKEYYLLNCCRYIELNPIRAGIVNHPIEYKWSSFSERMTYGINDETDIKIGIKEIKKIKMNDEEGNARILDLDKVFLSLGETGEIRLKHYEKFIGETSPPEEISFLRDSVKRGQLTGNSIFEEAVQRIIGIRIERRSQGRPFKKDFNKKMREIKNKKNN